MWIVQAGERGLPIINELEYINEDVNPNIRKINLHRYISGRLVVEIFCGNNNIGLEMSNVFTPLVKQIQLDRLYSQVSLEQITLNQESTEELQRLLAKLTSKYSVPLDVISDINRQIKKMSDGYSPCFYKQRKAAAKTEAKEASHAINSSYNRHSNDMYVSIRGDGYKSLEERQRVEPTVLAPKMGK